MTFTPEQQKYLQGLLDRNYVKVHLKLKAEYEAEVDRLKARIAELEASKNKFSFWRKS